MVSDVRIRINQHRLMTGQAPSVHGARVDATRTILDTHNRARRQSFHMRSLVHLTAFGCAFVFTTGALVLAVLLWVRPDHLLLLVAVSIAACGIFVASFATLRFLTLVHVFPNLSAHEVGEEEHHLAKSVAYGFVALVFAILLAGLLINVATAFTL